MNGLRRGYVKWINPFNRRPTYVSFERTGVIVFWSKNPRPLMPYLSEIDSLGISYYFQFTLNDYERERLEPRVPPLFERVRTFIELSKMLGKDRVIWRFDPLILLKEQKANELIAKIKGVGDRIHSFTSKLVFSYADIGIYKKVRNNLKRHNISYQEFDNEKMLEVAEGIAELCKDWRIKAFTCAERIDLSRFDIHHNKCIDDELILKIAPEHPSIRRMFRPVNQQNFAFMDKKDPLKDPGQRLECGCVVSKDIGQYNTCPHLCLYCYANSSETVVLKNYLTASRNKSGLSITGE